MTDTLRVLAEKAIVTSSIHEVYGQQYSGNNMDADSVLASNAFRAAASPEAIIGLLDRIARLEGALKPFSDMAGELFARNWNNGDFVTVLDNPGDTHRITAGDYFNARAALAASHEMK